MILRHSRTAIDGQPPENTFLIIDDKSGSETACAVVHPEELSTLYPARPLQVRIDFDCQGQTVPPDMLLGAAVARAKEICYESGELSRIHTRCATDDEKLLKCLELHGFKDSDGLVRMQMRLPTSLSMKAPAGLTIVYDELDDQVEQKYFLERYNALYSTHRDLDWLASYIDRPNFMRIAAISQTGMAGEVLIWKEGYSGVIGFIQSSKRWRHLGVASYLISLACEEFEEHDLFYAEAAIRARIPYVIKLMEKCGFTQSELLMRYPGIDINPV